MMVLQEVLRENGKTMLSANYILNLLIYRIIHHRILIINGRMHLDKPGGISQIRRINFAILFIMVIPGQPDRRYQFAFMISALLLMESALHFQTIFPNIHGIPMQKMFRGLEKNLFTNVRQNFWDEIFTFLLRKLFIKNKADFSLR